MKKITLFFLSLTICYFSYNNLVLAALNQDDYKKAAENFLFYQGSNKKIISEEILKDSSLVTGYIMNLEKGGYILIPATEFMPPVKAYSLKSDFKTLPAWYKNFLKDELTALQNIKPITARNSINNANALKWDFLLNYKGKSSRAYTPGTFLLKTKWGQDYPYNKMLPEIDGKNVATGCSQIAQAQVMNYHQHPKQGRGIAVHTWNDRELTAVLYKNYHWENMPETINTVTPEYIQDELALLIRDIAIVNKAKFDTAGTPSSTNICSMIEYFAYAAGIKKINNSDEELFFKILKNEIDDERPVLLALPSHATVADGYRSDQTGDSIHINMGWEGHDDDFYYLNNTTIETTQMIFPITPPNLDIIYNIKPCSNAENNCHNDMESTDAVKGSIIQGRFNYEYDVDVYPVYLKGMTSITGTNGFYIILYDSAGKLIDFSNSSINQDLPADKYRIKISLESEDGWFYNYDEFNNDYTANISTQSLTTSEIDAIENQDESPVIYNEFKDIVIAKEHKIRINAVDPDGDTLLVSAYASTQDINISFADDILAITPNVEKGFSHITVKAAANSRETEKTFTVLINNEKIYWGKEFTINGRFENQDDVNQYPAILDGTCTISGYRGYLNQAFFISVKDLDENNIVNPVDYSFTNTFSSGIYHINSLLGGGYSYSPEFSTYSIFASCPESSLEIDDIAAVLGIDMSVTPGDINHKDGVNLQDVILSLKICAKVPVQTPVYADADINKDDQIGLQEAIYGLKLVAEVQ